MRTEQGSGRLLLRSKERSVAVEMDEICYIRQQLDHVLIVTRRGTFAVRDHLDQADLQLHEDFYRCHTYLWINLRNVRAIGGNLVRFGGGIEVDLSKNYIGKARSAFEAYARRRGWDRLG